MKRTLLIKSKNIKENEWLIGGIKMLNHDIVPNDVPKIIEKEIEIYNNNIGIRNNNSPKKKLGGS